MKIVVTDGATLNPGDLSWAQLEKLGTCEIYPNSTPEENLQRCADADIAITNKVTFDKEVIAALPNLKMIAVTATGYNIIDIQAATDRGIIVSNVPVYSTHSVAQMVFALLLELCHHVGHHSQTARSGKWANCEDFCYWDKPLIELDGMTMGIIGTGKIGKATAKLAQAFGMKTIGYSRTNKPNDCGIEIVPPDTLLAQSDVITLHCPLTDDNNEMVNKDFLAKMKPTAFLINTSRGGLVNEQALADALNNSTIAGAAADVLSTEPPKPNNPLLTAKNCYITPHIAWATEAARIRLLNTTIENVKAFIEGNPQNRVQ